MSGTLTDRLTEAETALHKLVTGQMAVVVVDQNGERVEFSRANINQLRAYIKDLQAQIAGLNTTRRAIGFIY